MIPPELSDAVREQRLLPFVGAGLSAALGLPLWHELLATVAPRVLESIDYDELRELCHDDVLRIAEYVVLASGREIGPLRHRIAQALRSDADPAGSSGHVELVNLGARRIYTTNYDDLVESTFEALGEEHSLIAVAR